MTCKPDWLTVWVTLENMHLGQESCTMSMLQGFEIGSGFSGARMLGSEHNDEFYMDNGAVSASQSLPAQSACPKVRSVFKRLVRSRS